MPRRHLSRQYRTCLAAMRSRSHYCGDLPTALFFCLCSFSVAVAWISRIPVAACYSCFIDTWIHIFGCSFPLLPMSHSTALTCRALVSAPRSFFLFRHKSLLSRMPPSLRNPPAEPTQVKGERESLDVYLTRFSRPYTKLSPSRYPLIYTAWTPGSTKQHSR